MMANRAHDAAEVRRAGMLQCWNLLGGWCVVGHIWHVQQEDKTRQNRHIVCTGEASWKVTMLFREMKITSLDHFYFGNAIPHTWKHQQKVGHSHPHTLALSIYSLPIELLSLPVPELVAPSLPSRTIASSARRSQCPLCVPCFMCLRCRGAAARFACASLHAGQAQPRSWMSGSCAVADPPSWWGAEVATTKPCAQLHWCPQPDVVPLVQLCGQPTRSGGRLAPLDGANSHGGASSPRASMGVPPWLLLH